MGVFQIPNAEGKIRQLNLGDGQGEIVESFGIDLHTKPGKILLARPFRQVATASQIGNDPIEALVYGDLSASATLMFALTQSNLYSADNVGDDQFTTWALEDATPANAHDAVIYRSELIISTTADLDAYDGNTFTSNWWTAEGNYTADYALPSQSPVVAAPIILEVMRIGEETLAVTAGSSVHAMTGARGSGTFTTVDLDETMTACCIKSGIRKVYIGTFSRTGQDAFVYQWDGASTNYDEAFPIGAKACLAMELVDNTPIIITERGEIKLFNNAGFREVARFPFSLLPAFGVSYNNDNNINRPIHPKGVKVVGNKMLINVNFKETTGSVDNRTHSGLWVLDLQTYSLVKSSSPANEQYFDRTSPILVIDDESGRVFMGADRSISADEEGIYKEDLRTTVTAYGHFTSPEIESEGELDHFKEVVIKALLGSDDKIVVKYRTGNDVQLPVTASDVGWVSATQFNTTADLSAIKTRFEANIKNRDEVEIIKGYGAGKLAHITAITKSGSTYEVTIDEEIGSAGQLSDIRVDNWKKIPKEMVSTDGEKMRFGIGEDAPWCQYRVYMEGKVGRPEIRNIKLKSNLKEQ